jgi:tryptophan-rich sensory protein
MKVVDGESGPGWAYDGHNRLLALATGLSPVWLIALFYFTQSPSSGGGIYQPSEAERMESLRAVAFVYAIAAALTVAGTIVIWRARSPRAVLAAYALLTIPALILMIMGPAFVLILRNMTT